jgi:imidazolonepropionase-like amidohydrolase
MYKNSANALALGSSIGCIAEGKYCDFVLYEEDPMENPRILYKPSEVYIAGKRVR